MSVVCACRAVLQDLKDACTRFPDDQELHVVMETFQLARDGLNANPGELAGQLVGRIHGTGSTLLLRQAKEMMENGTLPEEAVPILSLLEAFEVKHQEKNKVRSHYKMRGIIMSTGFGIKMAMSFALNFIY